MITYKLNKGFMGHPSNSANKTNGNGTITSFPFALDNTDYQAYLKWVSEGGVPLPADE
jgi:hypothetical protein